MKEKINTLTAIWSNKRYRALIILGLYILFFMFVISFIKDNDSKIKEYEKNNIQKTSFENLNSQENYEYNYLITYNGITLNVEGTRFKNKEKFKLNDNRYYKINDKIYATLDTKEISIEELEFDIFKYSPKNISLIIENKPYIDKIKYNNNEILTEYDLEEYQIKTLEYNNFIYQIDLTDKKTNENIKISYKNINKISDFEIKELPEI